MRAARTCSREREKAHAPVQDRARLARPQHGDLGTVQHAALRLEVQGDAARVIAQETNRGHGSGHLHPIQRLDRLVLLAGDAPLRGAQVIALDQAELLFGFRYGARWPHQKIIGSTPVLRYPGSRGDLDSLRRSGKGGEAGADHQQAEKARPGCFLASPGILDCHVK